MRAAAVIAFLLCLAPLRAQVDVLPALTVSALRSPTDASRVAFTTESLSGDAFADGPALTVDGTLQSDPAFILFRRSGSLTDNPTAQGVSLRGLGPSGASRTLVLWDDVPLNDPFGGWIPWSMVPVGSVASAEVVPGAGATAWGNAALAGVVALTSRRPEPGSGSLDLGLGDFGTRSAAVSDTLRAGPGALTLIADTFSTAGFGLVDPAERGPVDTDAASRHTFGQARWTGALPGALQASVTLRSYDEWRDNGTAYQQNRLHLAFASAEVSGSAAVDEHWSATAYAQDQGASQTFSSVNSSRTAETPASNQFAVPASALGASLDSTWGGPDSGQWTLGADLRSVAGETREAFNYSASSYTQLRFAGGRQDFAGAFTEGLLSLSRSLTVTAGARFDRWSISGGHLRTLSSATQALVTQSLYPDRTGDELSPSAGLTWKATDSVEFHASAERAFRVPTLNELFRPFRQGTTVTLANPLLATEHADSAEVGASWRSGSLRASATAFAARLEDPVANVTLAVGPGTFPGFGALQAGALGQERLNLGRIDSRGGQLGADWDPNRAWSLSAGLLLEDARVAAAPVSPGLVGNRPPEVPRWGATAGVTWRPADRLTCLLRVRLIGSQFDDDRNQLALAQAEVADASVRLSVSAHTELSLAVDNLAGSRVETAHSALGVYSLAPPRLASLGLRVSW